MSADELLNRGIGLYHDGHLYESARLLRAGVANARRDGDADTEMLALSNLAEAYTVSGQLEDAEKAAVQLLQRAREEEINAYEVRAIGRLAIAVLQRDVRGQWRELQPQLEKSVQLARRLRLDYWVVQNLETLGACAQSVGEPERSLEWFQQALLPLGEEVNEEEFFRARIYARLGELYAGKDKARRSGEYLDLAVEYSERSGSPHLKAQVDLARGRCALLEGDAEGALIRAHAAYLAACRGGWQVDEHSGAQTLASIYLELDQRNEADAPACRALELAREMKMTEAEIEALVRLAGARRRRVSEARRYLEAALAQARKHLYNDHVVAITVELARIQ